MFKFKKSNDVSLTEEQSQALIKILDGAIAETNKAINYFTELYKNDSQNVYYAITANQYKSEIDGLEFAKHIIRVSTKH